MNPGNSLAVVFSTAFLAAFTTAAYAQQPPSAPPSWQQGRNAEQEKSPLHPFAIEVTGKSAKELPVDKLKVPDGFKSKSGPRASPERARWRSAAKARCSWALAS